MGKSKKIEPDAYGVGGEPLVSEPVHKGGPSRLVHRRGLGSHERLCVNYHRIVSDIEPVKRHFEFTGVSVVRCGTRVQSTSGQKIDAVDPVSASEGNSVQRRHRCKEGRNCAVQQARVSVPCTSEPERHVARDGTACQDDLRSEFRRQAGLDDELLEGIKCGGGIFDVEMPVILENNDRGG